MKRLLQFALGLVTFGFTALPRSFSGVSPGPERVSWPRRIARAVPALLAFVAALMVIYLIGAGWLYPLRPDVIEHVPHPLEPVFGPGTWGGPTLLGAWAAHAAIAIGGQAVCCGLIALCRRGWYRLSRGK